MIQSNLCFLLVMILFFCGVLSGELRLSNYKYIQYNETIEYSCTAKGKVGDWLYWHQTIGEKTKTLRRVQHTSAEMKLTLHMTLQGKDNNTEIFCANGTLIDKSVIKSEYIRLRIPKKNNLAEKPYVTVVPDSNPVYFEVNTMYTFFCNGSKPMDGRKLTWYIQGPDSNPTYIQTQTWNNMSYTSTLTLNLDETFHEKEIFCAQDFVDTDATDHFYIGSYGETARKMIRLYQQEINNKSNEINKEDGKGTENADGTGKAESQNTTEDFERGITSPLVYGVPVAVVVLLLVAATVWLLRRWQHTTWPTPGKTDDECIYAIPKVSYVTLDFKHTNTEYASSVTQDKTPYAQIIGIYRPDPQQRS